MINRTMHDGVEMVTEIVEFMNEVKKKSPRLVFKPNDRMKFGYMQADAYHYAQAGFDVFADDSPNEKIGMLYLENGNPYNYCVMSRLITNAKYSHWNSTDHRTKKSKHRANAIKTAIKVLKPVQLVEIYNNDEEGIKQHIHAKRNKLSSGMQSALMGVSRSSWHLELLNMIDIGYVPVDKEVKRVMEYVVNNREELKQLQAYDPNFAIVRVCTDRVEYGYKGLKETHSVSDISKLPEDIAGKMFVLNISEENKFVDEVGIKRPNNVYWVIL